MAHQAIPSPSASAIPELLAAFNSNLARLNTLASRLPGSAIAWRYLKASHQDDPIRTLLEIALVFFVIRTYAQSRTKGDSSGKNFVKLSEKVRWDPWATSAITRESGRAGWARPTLQASRKMSLMLQQSWLAKMGR